jgi:hypothetical protein
MDLLVKTVSLLHTCWVTKFIQAESETGIVMIVAAGPNVPRKDYHANETEVLFYQLEAL